MEEHFYFYLILAAQESGVLVLENLMWVTV